MFKKNTPTLGFGLVELIVSLSIVTIVTSIVLARHNAFNGAVLLRNQAYEIAFVIREAQQLAVSGQTNLSESQKQRYGVALSSTSSGSLNNQTIILYKDNNNNRLFDTGDSMIKEYRLDSRFEIGSLIDSTNNTYAGVRIVFERPFFDANFYRGGGNGALVTGPVRIVIRPVSSGSSAPERVINISPTGQVMVENN